MVTHVLSVIDSRTAAPSVTEVASQVAHAVGADVRQLGFGPRGVVVAETLSQLAAPQSVLAVVALDEATPAVPWAIASRCTKPVILIPTAARQIRHESLGRLLVPMDGSSESIEAFRTCLSLFTSADLAIVVLHVFDRATTPRFWDQGVHARRNWEQEFLARHCPATDVQLELRSGVPGELVVDVATEERVDLIAVAWSQQLGRGRARTVKRVVAGARTPVMLVPPPERREEARDLRP